jgi:sortase (surface protein transpeptidase)
MKNETRLTGAARIIGLLIALALLLSLLLPLAGAAAQDAAEEEPTTAALAEVPSTGARRPGPVLVASVPVSAPDQEMEETPAPEGVAPVEMVIDSVGVDAPIEVGAIVDGAMADPSGPWVVAWYDQLGKLGEGTNVVMSGHVDYYNSGPGGTPGPAVFWDVPNMAAGEIIRLVAENGEVFEYAVEWTKLYNVATELTPEVIQNDIVGDTGQESLTLITCGGPFDPATGEYLERWVLRANLI